MAAPMHVVVLAGGFCKTNTSQVEADAGSSTAVQHVGNGGQQHANPGLAPVHGHAALEFLLRALDGVRRLTPLRQHATIVVSEADKQLFYGSDRSTLLSSIADMGFSEANFVSNGAHSVEQWKGDVSDLQLAIRQRGIIGHVVAVSSSLTTVPGYNMQRVVEHSLVRNRDTVGTSVLSFTDIVLRGSRDHCLASPADTVPVPPLASIALHCAAREGDLSVDPLLVLGPKTVQAHVMGSAAGNLCELAAELLNSKGVELHGIDLGWGRMRLDSAACCDYADRFVSFFLDQVKPEGLLDPEGDPLAATGLGKLNRVYAGAAQDERRMQELSAQFDRMYCSDGRAQAGVKLPQYNLPSTFYMTATRRQMADIMR